MIYTENNRGVPSARSTGALRAPVVVVFCVNHWKTGIHQKRVHTNESAALEGQFMLLVLYILIPNLVVKKVLLLTRASRPGA
jgi:hypothetical protein